MSFGPSLVEEYTQAGKMVARILRNDPVGSIPLYQPFNFELRMNSKTAKALGIDIPDSLRTRAKSIY